MTIITTREFKEFREFREFREFKEFKEYREFKETFPMRTIYTIGIWFYTLGVRVAALCGHEKARLMVSGWRTRISIHNSQPSARVAWFHAASLGEFEQARPVLERYKELHPDCRIVVTFFSPSGYEVRKNYAQADAVLYLPPDLPCSVRRFLDAVKPTVAFFVKYEFWFNYLGELRRRSIPTYIFSAIFRPGQYFFKPWGRWYLLQLKECFRHLFVQNEESLQLLKAHGIEHCSLAGDTRYDRVHQIATAAEGDATAETFLQGYEGKVMVAGSTWPPDEQLLARLRDGKEWFPERLVIAPHQIHEEHLRSIEALFPDSVRYSQLRVMSYELRVKRSVLIIDNIGILSKLYRYADVAYIGGGFGVGIHNILEAVAYGKPVVFGPNWRKFQEAHDIIELGGGMTVDEQPDVSLLRKWFTDEEVYRAASDACLKLMRRNLGSTDIILNTLEA
ncbi:MAG: 3-deoxy-D-manno-octulosonic acid transferase [Bacteroidales bacterium]|nr:3-deoxy-D-manno-octulosonic acid transferase [Bacteroidales bacterium]